MIVSCIYGHAGFGLKTIRLLLILAVLTTGAFLEPLHSYAEFRDMGTPAICVYRLESGSFWGLGLESPMFVAALETLSKSLTFLIVYRATTTLAPRRTGLRIADFARPSIDRWEVMLFGSCMPVMVRQLWTLSRSQAFRGFADLFMRGASNSEADWGFGQVLPLLLLLLPLVNAVQRFSGTF
jgi:hypothetical protein